MFVLTEMPKEKDNMYQATKLLISNVPAHCPDEYLRNWIEARGYKTFSVKLVRDVVSGTSPSFAYVHLMDTTKLEQAGRALDKQTLWNHVLQVRLVIPLSSVVRPAAWTKIAS